MQLSLQGILKGGKNKSRPVSTSQTPLCMPHMAMHKDSTILPILLADTSPRGAASHWYLHWYTPLMMVHSYFPEVAVGHFNIRENDKRLEISVTITNTEVVKSEWTLSTEPRLALKNPWKGEPEDTLSPFKGEMYHERLGICYKVAYNSTHGWKARAWGTHWSSGPPKYTVYPFIHPVCSS